MQSRNWHQAEADEGQMEEPLPPRPSGWRVQELPGGGRRGGVRRRINTQMYVSGNLQACPEGLTIFPTSG